VGPQVRNGGSRPRRLEAHHGNEIVGVLFGDSAEDSHDIGAGLAQSGLTVREVDEDFEAPQERCGAWSSAPAGKAGRRRKRLPERYADRGSEVRVAGP